MAKKRAKKVIAAQDDKTPKAVRLDLLPVDHRRLEKAAREKGLNMASYARMAVLERIKADEGKGAKT